MIKRLKLALMLSVTVLLTQATSAFAGDAATVIFESGLVIKIDDGFTQLIKRMSSLNRNSSDHVIEQLNIGGSTFALNLAQVVVVCRDECKTITVRHQLDPKRGK